MNSKEPNDHNNFHMAINPSPLRLLHHDGLSGLGGESVREYMNLKSRAKELIDMFNRNPFYAVDDRKVDAITSVIEAVYDEAYAIGREVGRGE